MRTNIQMNAVPSYEDGLVRLVSPMIHTNAASVNRLIRSCEDYRCQIPESDDYRGIDISAVTMGDVDFGPYHRSRIPMKDSGCMLNILRTLVSEPGRHDSIDAMVSDRPLSMREFRVPNVYASSAREYLIDSVKVLFLEGLSSYSPDRNIGVADFIAANSDADAIVAYARDDAMLNSGLIRAGMRPASGNLGKNASERVFAWYVSR